jgi:hypothetical protein
MEILNLPGGLYESVPDSWCRYYLQELVTKRFNNTSPSKDLIGEMTAAVYYVLRPLVDTDVITILNYHVYAYRSQVKAAAAFYRTEDQGVDQAPRLHGEALSAFSKWDGLLVQKFIDKHK